MMYGLRDGYTAREGCVDSLVERDPLKFEHRGAVSDCLAQNWRTQTDRGYKIYLTLKNVVTLRCRLGITHLANLRTIRKSLISSDYLSVADSIGLSSFASTLRAPAKL